MSRKSITLEMRGMPRADLISYFETLGGKAINDEIYVSNLWEIRVHQQCTCYLGRLSIPSTKIDFSIADTYYAEMLYKFRLSFMCAGG